MANLAFWDEPDGPWDRVVLSGKVMPGAWSVNCTCERQIDKKKTKGKDGAHIKDHGYQPAEVTLKGTLWTREQWQELQKILPKLHPRKKGGPRNPLNAVHPALAVMGISRIYVHRIKAPTVGDKGLELDIECTEWTPPKPVKKPPDPDDNGRCWVQGTWGSFATMEGTTTPAEEAYLERKRQADPGKSLVSGLKAEPPRPEWFFPERGTAKYHTPNTP